MADNILEISGLTKTYPGVVALDSIDLNVRRGEIHAIVGENGAGKSTLIKCITGAVSPDKGIIRFDGKEYTHFDPATSAQAGIGVIYQEFNLVPMLSVAENVFLGNLKGNGVTVNFKEMELEAGKVLESLGVHVPPGQPVETLSVGHQQTVEIARSLTKNLRLLIMDEPSAPLTTSEVEQMIRIVRTLKEKGISIIYISHRLEEIFELADRVTVMRDGQYITTINVADTDMKELIRYMVGRELTGEYPPRTKPIGEETLRVEHLTGNGVKEINFTLHRGEILGFAGLLGAGRTETMQVIFGARKKDGGQIYLNGKAAEIRDTTQALESGIGLIPEDRKRNGVFLPMSIAWNTGIACLRKKLSRGMIVDQKKEQILAREYMNKLRTKATGTDQPVENLSGGNQQKVVVAKTLAADSEIIIFDEPTRGIDVGAKQEMYKLIRELADEGRSIIMVSSEMAELIGLSDRMVVLCEGRQMGILEREEFTQERILSLASGIQA